MIYTRTAPTGKYLTQTSAVSDDERIFAKTVSSASDTLDLDWRIATDEEVAAWESRKAEQAALDAEERAAMEAQAAAEAEERKARAAREERRRKAQEERDAQILAAQEAAEKNAEDEQEQEAETGESDTEVGEAKE